MRLLWVLLALVVALVGCASRQARYDAYDKSVRQYMLQPEASLVAALGPPDNVYDSNDGTRILTYLVSRNVTLPGQPPSYTVSSSPYGGTVAHPSGGSPDLHLQQYCRTLFWITDGKVSNYKFEGNYCRVK